MNSNKKLIEEILIAMAKKMGMNDIVDLECSGYNTGAAEMLIVLSIEKAREEIIRDIEYYFPALTTQKNWIMLKEKYLGSEK